MVSSDVLRGVLTGSQYKRVCELSTPIQNQIREKAKTLPREKVRALVQLLLGKIHGTPQQPTRIDNTGKGKQPLQDSPVVFENGHNTDKGKQRIEESSACVVEEQATTEATPPPPKRKPQWKSLRAKKVRKPEPMKCTNPGCNWATDHRPRNFDRVVGNKTAKDKLREWMRQREDLRSYINARRSVRLPKYKAAIAGETTGDKVFDSKPVPTVALLHGPPGVGKTTLAALFMTMYKLHFEEVNASDINTEDKLISVLQRTVYAPNCGLILDEFDGIFQGGDTKTGVPKLLQCLGGLNVMAGPVVLIVNDVTQGHVKSLRATPTCLDVRLFPVDKKDLYTVLADMLTRHDKSLSGGIKSKLIADCNGDVRMMLNSTQFTLVGHSAGDKNSVVVGGNDAQSDQMFSATADLLSGKGTLHTSTLYGDPSLLLSLAFHNHLPAAVKGDADLEALSTRVDALSVMDCRGWRANSLVMDVVDQTFKAHPLANAVNTYKSRVRPNEHNVEWPVSALLKRAASVGVPTWVTNPTLPHDAFEEHSWNQIMSIQGPECQGVGALQSQWVSTILERASATGGVFTGMADNARLKKRREPTK